MRHRRRFHRRTGQGRTAALRLAGCFPWVLGRGTSGPTTGEAMTWEEHLRAGTTEPRESGFRAVARLPFSCRRIPGKLGDPLVSPRSSIMDSMAMSLRSAALIHRVGAYGAARPREKARAGPVRRSDQR